MDGTTDRPGLGRVVVGVDGSPSTRAAAGARPSVSTCAPWPRSRNVSHCPVELIPRHGSGTGLGHGRTT